MSDFDLFNEKSFSVSEKRDGNAYNLRLSSKQSLKAKFDKEFGLKENAEECSFQLSRTGGSWCDALSLSMPNVNAKQAWKNGTDKLSQTFNNVRTTFGTLSQKIKKSTRRKQPLINSDSPKTPATPYTRSRALLGRTPTKLYSPFRIDTPSGKENSIRSTPHNSPANSKMKFIKKKSNKGKTGSKISTSYNLSSPERSNELLQTQIGIYEFHSVANRIARNGLKN